MRFLIALALLSGVAHAQTTEKGNSTAPIVKNPDDDGEVKLSMPTEEDRLAWERPGFRLGLALAYGEFKGLGGAPSGRLLGPQVHAGLRLDKDWSIVISLEYARASAANELSGLRFAGTIDPIWHVTQNFSLALGVGFGGIVEGRTNRATPVPPVTNTSYTYPDSSTPLSSCSGVGIAGLARAEYGWVLGKRERFSAMFEVVAQNTGCVARAAIVEPDTAQPIEQHQYWNHIGATLAVGITWR